MNQFQPPERILDAIGLKPGMVIGEVGAGRGRFTVRLAERVGPRGLVYANDIDKTALAHLEGEARRNGLDNIKIILGQTHDPCFRPGSLDMAFMINVYNAFEDPVRFLRNIAPALKPDGTLAIVLDDPAKSGGESERSATREQFLASVEKAGYKIEKEETLLRRDGLYVLRPKRGDVPKLTGPYLGQKPPGLTPEVFAPGIVSKEGNQAKLFLTPDGTEIIFVSLQIVPGRGNDPADRDISFISIKMVDRMWGEPAVLSFSRDFVNDEPSLSYDGKRLFFVSNRPKGGHPEAEKLPDIWMVEKIGGAWSKPQNVGEMVNTDDLEVQPFYSSDDKLYFIRRDGIYYSQFSGNAFSMPVKLDEKLLKGRPSGICISPDNTMLMVHSNMAGGLGSFDLYVSFKQKTGEWGSLINVGAPINSEESEGNATFSPDGKYLFFSRKGDIYWVSAKILEELKKKG